MKMYSANGNRFRLPDRKYTNIILSILILFVLEANSCEVKPIKNALRSIRSTPQCSALSKDARFDCNPDEPIGKDICLARGCCWDPERGSSFLTGSRPARIPSCYFPTNFEGYKLMSKDVTPNSVKIKLQRKVPSGFPDDIANVEIDVIGLDEERVRVRIVDPNSTRWEVRLPSLNVSQQSVINSPLYKIDVSDIGELQISRRSSGNLIFQADLRRLIFADQILQLPTEVPSKYLYGLGERYDHFQKKLSWKRVTIFNRDSSPIPHQNLYGSFPFYLTIEDMNKKDAHGVFLLNSNPMEVILQPKPAVTWRSIGGILDFFIFLGPSAPSVIRQYHSLIGKPVMQPYWSLGFHLCRYNYGTLENTNQTLLRNLDSGIPIDVQWNDIDYMERYNDFTYDGEKFGRLPEFVNQLHARGMHYIPIIDAGIGAGEKPGTYPPYDEGVRDGIFIMNASSQEPFIGKVWNPVSTVWPDFSNEKTWEYWTRQFKNFHQKLPFDGAWIDMNEPANFLDGQERGCSDNKFDNPPYRPGVEPLEVHTLCMNAQHKYGPHYDLHSLHGLHMTYATYKAMTEIRGARPLIVSRSTFSGQGHYGSHWSGDIYSDWENLRYSIINVLDLNFFGIPMIGSDICGFHYNTTVELCARWSSLGAFYPFSRNHNDFDTIDQDPVALGPKVVAAAKYALNLRYTLIPYLYTLFFKAHYLGDTVARPLFFEFPEDKETYPIENQFMWGSAIMIVPILEPDIQDISAYFPTGIWFDYATKKVAFKSLGEYIDVHIDYEKIGVFLRGGSIIPVAVQAMNTVEQRKSPFKLLIAPDESRYAQGEYFIDDGESLDNIPKGIFTWTSCTYQAGRLKCQPMKCNQSEHFDTVIILNSEPISRVMLKQTQIHSFIYNLETKALEVKLPADFDHCQGLELEIF